MYKQFTLRKEKFKKNHNRLRKVSSGYIASNKTQIFTSAWGW